MKRFWLFLMFPALLGAQTYHLDEMVNKALENNLSIKQTKNARDIATSEKTNAQWNLLPQIKGSWSYQNGLGDKLFFQNREKTEGQLGLTLSKTISMNDPAYFNYRFAQLNRETAQLTLDNQKKSLAFNVVSAYIAVLKMQKQLEIDLENVSLQENIVNQNKSLLEQKKITDFDLKQSDIALLNAKITVMKTRNALMNLRKSFFNLILIQDEGYSFSEMPFIITSDLPAFQENQITELQISEQEIKQQRISLLQKKLDYLPEMSVSYQFNKSGKDTDLMPTMESGTQTAMLNVSYSLFDLITKRETIKQSKLTLINKQLAKDSRRNDLYNQYLQEKSDWENLIELSKMYELKRSQTAEQMQIAEEKYQLGMISQLDLDKVRVEYTDSKISYENNRYDILLKQESVNKLLSMKICNQW